MRTVLAPTRRKSRATWGRGYVGTGTEHASASTRYIPMRTADSMGGSITTLDDGSSVICTGMVGGAVAAEVENWQWLGSPKSIHRPELVAA